MASADGRGQILVAVAIPVADRRFAANGSHSTSGNVNGCFSLCAARARPDRGTLGGADCGHIGIIRDGDAGICLSPLAVAGTDPCAAVRTHGCDLHVAGDLHRASAVTTTADTGSVLSAISGHISVVRNADVHTFALFTTADACTAVV